MKRTGSILFSLLLVLTLMPAAAFGAAGHTEGRFDRLGSPVTFGGYFETEYEDVEGAPGDFDQHRTILFFGTQPHERIRFFSELEIEHGGAPDIKLEQAWLEFALTGSQNLRAGIDLIPVGRLNLEHDGNLRDFVFRPAVDGQLIPSTWFESGIGLNGAITETLDYQVGISNGMRPASATDTGTADEIDSMLGSGTVLSEGDNNNSKAVWSRVAWTPLLGSEFAVSGYQSDYAPDRSITFLALDGNYVVGPFEFKGEAVSIDKDQQAPGGITGASGGYLETAYHFFPNGLRDSWLASGFDNPTFTALARYETLDFDLPADPDDHDRNILSLGFNYRPMERMAFKVSYDVDDRQGAAAQDRDRVGAGMVLGF